MTVNSPTLPTALLAMVISAPLFSGAGQLPAAPRISTALARIAHAAFRVADVQKSSRREIPLGKRHGQGRIGDGDIAAIRNETGRRGEPSDILSGGVTE